MIRYDQTFTGDSGEFYLPETGRYFTFRPTADAWAAKHELIHAIDVLDGVRFGIVRKGVAYIATDEDAYGNPVLERWHITKRITYKETA
jgi:hypothetical protein